MGIRLESLTLIPDVDIGQLAAELVSTDTGNTAELGTDGRLLVRPPEKQEFSIDLRSVYLLST